MRTYVGTLLFKQVDGYYSCTGTMLSPTVMLTAGHCTESGGVVNEETWVKFTPAISLPGRSNYPTLKAYLDDEAANGWIKGDAVPHPLYNDYAQFPKTYDVGLVILRHPVPGLTQFGTLPPLGFLETIAHGKGGNADNRFLVVGYGMQGLIKPFESDIWERYKGTLRLIELNSTNDGGQSAKFTNNPGQGGGTCFGDSGGPIFYGDTNMVAAVVSWGITPCIGVDYNFRTDTEIARAFIQSYLEQ